MRPYATLLRATLTALLVLATLGTALADPFEGARSVPYPPPFSPTAARPGTGGGDPPSLTRLPLKSAGGVFVVPVEINGTVTLDFTIDSGAATVVIPAGVFASLKEAGTIHDEDIVGPHIYVLADGSRRRGDEFTIRSLKVGDIVVENVRAGVMPGQEGRLLLGQSFLQKFKSWSINNTANELVLETEDAPAIPVAAPLARSPFKGDRLGTTLRCPRLAVCQSAILEGVEGTTVCSRNYRDYATDCRPLIYGNGAEQPATPSPPQPAAPAPTNAGWMIQVGAFPDEEEARQRLSSVQSRASRYLATADAFTESVTKGDSILYRARFAGLGKEQAEAVCDYLKRNDVECVTIRN